MHTRVHLLHDATYEGYAHELISDEPCCNTTETAGDDELEDCGRDEWIKQEADTDEHGRVNDVDRIGAAIEPRPEC